MMATLHKRRKRRSAKAALKHGRKAKTSHRMIGGRTGSVHARRLRARRHGLRSGLPSNVAHVRLL